MTRVGEAVDRLMAWSAQPRRVLIGIAGAPGAGKSTFARVVADTAAAHGIRTAVVPMDGFHLADVSLERLGLRRRKGAPETFDVDGYVSVLQRLRAADGRTVYAPGFSRDLEQPLAAAVGVGPEVQVVITEGNYLLLGGDWRPVRRILDEVWFVDCHDPTRRERLRTRHVRFGKSPTASLAWEAQVDEPNARLVRATRDLADWVVDLTDDLEDLL